MACLGLAQVGYKYFISFLLLILLSTWSLILLLHLLRPLTLPSPAGRPSVLFIFYNACAPTSDCIGSVDDVSSGQSADTRINIGRVLGRRGEEGDAQGGR